MRFLHVADLHIGKRVHEKLMLEDQRYVLDQLIESAEREKVDAVLVAGDVFDRTNPIPAALALAEHFFAGLVERRIPTYVIPGNHDSAQQVAYCSSITAAAGLHVARPFRGIIESFTIEDAKGPVRIHLLPFIRPLDARVSFPERADEIKTHEDAVRVTLEENPIDPDVRNVLVAHQFVSASGIDPERCDSESKSAVGGLDNVDASLFDAFDYVALGHLHGPQRVGCDEVRYAGSPMKYSFSEIDQKKAAVIVDIKGDRTVEIKQIPCKAYREMREITMALDDIEAGADNGDHECYMHVTLTDRSAYDAFNRVKAVYPNLLLLSWEEVESTVSTNTMTLEEMGQKTCFELFADFFEEQTGESMTDEERKVMVGIAQEQEGVRA